MRSLALVVALTAVCVSLAWAGDKPVPTAAEQDKALKNIHGVLKGDFAKATNSTAKSALSAKLLALGQGTNDDPVSRYVLIREARDQAVGAGDIEKALTATDAVAVDYEISVDDARITAYELLNKGPAKVSDLITAVLADADSTMAKGEFERTTRYLKLAEVIAARGNKEVAATVAARAKEFAAYRTAHLAYTAAVEKLKVDPQDASANLAAGRYLAFVKGDWAGGLPLLAKGSDAKLKAAATADLANPKSASDRAAVGELWFQLAAEDESSRSAARKRALFWYQSATGLTGFAQAKAEKRLEELKKDPVVATTAIVAKGDTFSNRFGEPKDAAIKNGGGSTESETAVTKGLEWLAKQQKANGSWVFDGTSSGDTVAGTGLSLLPFLGAGHGKKGAKYHKTVMAGVTFLLAAQQANGSFKGSSGMYSHGIITLALVEAFATSGDANLKAPAQKAINLISACQGNNGSWGYPLAKADGDTSILGWQAQALYAAKACKLTVPKKTVTDASAFLDTVGDAKLKSTYGYTDRNSIRPSLTAVGLLSRIELDDWAANNEGLVAGIKYLTKSWKPTKERFDLYYYFYATQVLFRAGGESWKETWNPQMRDVLVEAQIAGGKGASSGSWDPDTGMIGSHCGRLGTTALAILTLEVYYRYPPLSKPAE